MGKAHAMAYAAMPMFFWPAPAIPHRKVVVDLTEGAAQDARDRFGFDEASSDWKATVNRTDIDIVDGYVGRGYALSRQEELKAIWPTAPRYL